MKAFMTDPIRKKNRLVFFGVWVRQNKLALLVLALLLLEHLAAILALGIDYNLGSDDVSYMNAGANFIQTGTISCHEDFPSAQIMPGMPVLMGMFSLLFGEGTAYLKAAKLAWSLMGVLTAWFTYRTVCIFAPKWVGLLAMLPYFRPDLVWMDNILLTETPFMLCLILMVYYTFMMGKDGRWRYFWGCAIAYMCGLLLKANIALYPLFALLYLLFVRYDHKKLLKQICVLSCVVLMFIVPWSIRNYIQFHDFIPLTYGAGNPMLLGTYQGYGYPTDEELDYEANVNAVVRKNFEKYYLEDGSVSPKYKRYINLQRDSIKAHYRISEWMKKDFNSFVHSYAVEKPKMMITSYFYWDSLFGIDGTKIDLLQKADTRICIIAIVLSILLKQQRRPVLYLAAVYIVNVLIYAVTFSFSRYNASLMCLRFALVGFAAYLVVYAFSDCK